MFPMGHLRASENKKRRNRSQRRLLAVIEIQRVGNKSFIYRGLYYWAKSYTANLKAKNKYEDLNPVISINILDFNLTENKDKPHSCYFIKEFDTNEIFTNHFEMHFLELKKFNENTKLYEPLADWFKFLNIKKDLEDTMKVLVEKNPIMKEIYDKYNTFVKDDNLTENKGKPHSCYFIKEFDTNEILTNHFEMHFLELKKFNENTKLYEPLADWFKFLNIKKDLEDTMKVLVEKIL